MLTTKVVVPYFEFSPILFKEYQEDERYLIDEFDDIDEAIGIYFDNLRRSDVVDKVDIEKEVWRKFENIKKDQQGRLQQITEVKDNSFKMAQLIEANISEIQAIIDIITSLMEIGMTSIIKSVISQARKQGDPLASIIHKIDLAKSKVLVLLGNEENLEDTLNVVEIDINIGPYENAKKYYGQRSKLIEKELKTKEAAEIALKSAQMAAERQLDKHKKTVKVIKTNRRVLWFEKFYWFLTSENYLTISARDAAQNELIIKKYLGKNDIVFHTQIQGSAFTIIKNPNGDEITDISLN